MESKGLRGQILEFKDLRASKASKVLESKGFKDSKGQTLECKVPRELQVAARKALGDPRARSMSS